jgi:hypothetical protein
MGYIPGQKPPVYTPPGQPIDNNAEPPPGTPSNNPSAGNLQPWPNIRWLPTVPSVKADIARQEFLAKNGAIGNSEARREQAKKIAAALQLAQPVVSQAVEEQANQDGPSTNHVSQETLKSTQAALKADAQRADQRDQARNEAHERNLEEDKLRALQQAAQIAVSNGNAPAGG